MSFERYRVQVQIENDLGCYDLSLWSDFRSDLENYTLDDNKELHLREALRRDAEDVFFKGMLSLCEAINNIGRGLHSWATVKLYYSVFYFLRCSLALRDCAIIRNKSLYLLKIARGATPVKKTSTKYRNDHIGVISIFEDEIGETDLLLTNKIDEQNVYRWLMEKRHQVHYRQRDFCEPEFADFCSGIRELDSLQKLERQIILYLRDEIPVYCFNDAHACLAIPIKRATLTQNELISHGLKLPDKGKREVLEKLMSILPSDDSEIYRLINDRQS